MSSRLCFTSASKQLGSWRGWDQSLNPIWHYASRVNGSPENPNKLENLVFGVPFLKWSVYYIISIMPINTMSIIFSSFATADLACCRIQGVPQLSRGPESKTPITSSTARVYTYHIPRHYTAPDSLLSANYFRYRSWVIHAIIFINHSHQHHGPVQLPLVVLLPQQGEEPGHVVHDQHG